MNRMWRRYERLHGADPKADVGDELGFHVEAQTEELVRQGWAEDDARREAQRRFGNVSAMQAIGERMGEKLERKRHFAEYWAHCRQDVRFGLRTLERNPGFALVTILILALGIGANVAIFSVVNTLMLRPLPFPESDRLVWFTGGKHLPPQAQATAGLSGRTFTVDAFEEYERNNGSFAQLTFFQTFYGSLQYKLTGTGEPRRLSVVEVAENFFPTLDVTPVLGRGFSHDEAVKGGRSAALLSHSFWKEQFAGDAGIVGRPITVNGKAVTVVGILPESFDFGAVFAPGMKVDMFVPAVPAFWSTWGNTIAIVGRLKPAVTVAQAQAEADQLFPRLKLLHPDWYEDYASQLTGLKEHVEGSLRRSLVVLWSAAGMILLIVCVNLSNLQLGRAAARGKEFAMRRALGAGRARLIRQMLTESMVLSFAGGLSGLGVAWTIVFYLAHQKLVALPLLGSVRLDGAALGWTVLIAAVAGFLFGLAPALQIARGELANALRQGGLSAGRQQDRFRGALVVSEMALACMLLVGAGLLLRSFLRVLDVDLGFQPSHAAALQVDFDDQSGNLASRAAGLQEILRRVSALPGVEAAGMTDLLPLDRNRSWGFLAVGRPHSKDDYGSALVYMVTPGFLTAAGIHLRAGRDFSWDDTAERQHVVMINEAAARREWPGEDPIGKLANGIEKNPVKVIGVVEDIHETSPEAASSPAVYVPMTQNQDIEGITLVVRTRMDTAALGASVVSTLRTLNPSQPASEMRPLQSLVDHAVSARRFFVLLVTIFAGMGALLAALGLYGVISYSVTQKTQEIAVRLALGATAGRVQRDVLWQTLRLLAAGILVGTAASLGMARLIASLLFATSPSDPLAYGCVVAGLVLVGLAAGLLPARKAARIEPMAALRTQ